MSGRPGVLPERDAHDAALSDGLAPGAAALAVLFTVFAVWHAVEFPRAVATVMVPLAAGTALTAGAVYLVLRRARMPVGWSHPVAALLAVLALLNCVVQLALTGGLQLTVNVLMLIIAVGVCMVDPRWVVGLTLGFAGTWIAAVVVLAGTGPLSTVVSNLIIALVVAVMSNLLRRRTLVRLLEAQERLQETSQRCDLTGLLNRRGFLDAAQRRMDSGQAVTVWFIDVDELKTVNDRHGHDSGDLLLRDVAGVLATVFADGTVARLSGDEFAVMEGAATGPELAHRHQLLEEHLDAVAADRPWSTRVSAGTAAARSGQSLGEVLRAADTAMYTVKAARRRATLPRATAAPAAPVLDALGAGVPGMVGAPAAG